MAIGLAVTGCQPLPQPFRPDQKTLPAPPGGARAALVVRPAIGGPQETTTLLADRLAKTLQRRDIAASARPLSGEKYHLVGDIRSIRMATNALRLTFEWQLIHPSGEAAGSTSHRLMVPEDKWLQADEGTVDQVAADAALAVDELMRAQEGLPERDIPLTEVLVLPADGAPGDGRYSLSRALETGLQQRGFKVVVRPGNETYLITGTVEVSPYDTTQQFVAIRWEVSQGTGPILGTVNIGNPIPSGRLDGEWGEIALLAAAGGADGIADLFAQLRRRQAQSAQ